jgi:hypothetical protein
VSGIAPIMVRIDVDTSGLRKATSAAESMGSSLKNTLSIKDVAAGTALGNATTGAARLAMRGVESVIGGAFDEALTMGKLQAKTEAVIKSTGGAANVTAKQMSDLASNIETVSGAQLDEIDALNSTNVLATFTNIKNGAGATNDIFNQTTMAVADLSVAMGQDMQSSAVQLGKALNDPTKGMGALQRVGVTFTADQKKQIETLQKNNNIMGAQKIILAEVKREFGGAAAAMGKTPAGKFGAAMDSVKDKLRDVATKMLPALTKLATTFAEKIGPAMDKAAPVILQVFGFIVNNIGAIGTLVGIFAALAGIVKAYTAVQIALNLAMDANPIGIIIVGVGALVAGIVYLATQTTVFQDAFNAMGKAVMDVINAIAGAWNGVAGWIGGLFGGGTSTVNINANAAPSAAPGAANSNGGGTTVNNYNVQAKGLTVDQVSKDAKRRGNLAAPINGGK